MKTIPITIKSSDNSDYSKLQLINSSGQILISNRPMNSNMQLDISKFPSGVYYLQAIGVQKTQTFKFLVK